MVSSTRDSITDAYIVVLEQGADVVRALLFDGEARRVEGYSAQLPNRAEAAADCLDEMHRLAQAAGFRIGAVAGRAETEVTEQDRRSWPAFEGAAWFPALPEGAGAVLGSGCVGCERFALMIGEASGLGTIVDAPVEALSSVPIDEKRWLVAGAVPEAGLIYPAIKQKTRGSVEAFLETAQAGDPMLQPIEAAVRRFRGIFDALVKAVGMPSAVVGSGSVLLKSPSLSQRIADALEVPLTWCTEPEPAARGAALWALEKLGAIENLRALPASTGAVFEPVKGR
jgi:glycerol kinase